MVLTGGLSMSRVSFGDSSCPRQSNVLKGFSRVQGFVGQCWAYRLCEAYSLRVLGLRVQASLLSAAGC